MPQEEIVTARTEPPPRICSSCDKPATVAYRWEWGEEGLACPEHAATLQQTAGNLNRTVTVSPLQPLAPVPLERSERIQLHATILTLEAELGDAKARGLQLYNSNVELSRQVQLLNMRETEAKAQLKDADAVNTALGAKLEESETQCAELAEEVGRLRTLAQFVEERPPALPPQSGQQPDQHVVDG